MLDPLEPQSLDDMQKKGANHHAPQDCEISCMLTFANVVQISHLGSHGIFTPLPLSYPFGCLSWAWTTSLARSWQSSSATRWDVIWIINDNHNPFNPWGSNSWASWICPWGFCNIITHHSTILCSTTVAPKESPSPLSQTPSSRWISHDRTI